jgi:hypothetical protein
MTALLIVIPDAVLLTALLVSIALLPRRPGLLPVEAIPFGLFAVVTFVFHSLLAAYPRMLFPIVPVMIWLVVVVLSKCIRVVPPAASG